MIRSRAHVADTDPPVSQSVLLLVKNIKRELGIREFLVPKDSRWLRRTRVIVLPAGGLVSLNLPKLNRRTGAPAAVQR